MANLSNPRAPALPLAEPVYTRDYTNRFSNILRLYFAQLDATLQGLLGIDGGQYLQLAHVNALSSSNQYAAGDNVATQVTFSTAGSSSGFTIVSGTVTANSPGVYKMDCNLQLINTDATQRDVFVWFQVNGSVLANSSSRFAVPASGFTTAYSSVQVNLNVDDEIKVWWATDKAYNPTGPVNGVYARATAAQSVPYVRPANPSAVGSINFISRLP